jgi:hypothetical protein
MLFMHEVHAVAGERADEFEAAYREGWMPLLADGHDARLLWYLDHAHGSGPAYNVVTITAVRDGDAYQRLVEAMHAGALRDWSRAVGELRHHVDGKMLVPVEWSPLQEIALAHVPVDGTEHDLSLYMEDTGWPSVALDDYVEFWNVEYFQMMRRIPADRRILEIQACFQVAYGTHRRPEAVLMQKILHHDLLMNLISEPEDYDPDSWPGSYMHHGLQYRDQWESKLLRTSSWSPLH